MFFIVGWGHAIKKQIGPLEEELCPRCNNRKYWILEKQTQWVTLFFIPIIPTQTTYYKFCPVCGQTVLLSKDEFNYWTPLAELNQDAVYQNINDQEYEQKKNDMGY